MTNTGILTKAIQKAITGGWRGKYILKKILPYRYHPLDAKYVESTYMAILEAKDGSGFTSDYRLFIFNHDFAKALWGESKVLTSQEANDAGYVGGYGLSTIGWQDHLRKMVLADDPIKYLGENV